MVGGNSHFPQLGHGDVVYGAYADAPSPVVDERDLGEAAARILVDGRNTHARTAYRISGPANLTEAAHVGIIGAAIGRSISFVEVSAEDAITAMGAQMPEPIARAAMTELEERLQHAPSPTSDLERILGRAPIDFATWVQEHLDEISAS